MKTKLLLLLLFCINLGHAQNFWSETVPFATLPDYSVKSISIVDENVVWVCGSDANDPNLPDRVSLSLDGGITWTDTYVLLGSPYRHVSNIHAVSTTTAYISVYSSNVTTQGGIYLTVDAGVTWTKQPTALFNTTTESNACFVHLFDANNGVAVGQVASGYFEIYTTNNAGTNWNRVPSANFSQPPLDGEIIYGAMHYDANADSVWFGTNKGNIFWSSNKGFVWYKMQMPDPDFGAADAHFAFKDPDNGLYNSGNMGFFTIGINGYVWNVESFIPSGSLRHLNVVNVPQTSNTYFTWGPDQTNQQGASYSVDGGLSWSSIDGEDMSPAVTAKFYSSSIGYCTGFYLDDPTSLKFFRLTDVLNRMLKNDAFAAEKAFSVAPNPTKDVVKITGESISSILVYDLGGKLVLSEKHNRLDETTLNLSVLQTGVYFAKVVGDGKTETIKIIKH